MAPGLRPSLDGPIPVAASKRNAEMKFMLMMHCPRNGYEVYFNWPKPLLEANMAFMVDFNRKLRASGELVSGEGLAAPTEAMRVYLGRSGKPVTDGVFPETKEYLAGFWIID